MSVAAACKGWRAAGCAVAVAALILAAGAEAGAGAAAGARRSERVTSIAAASGHTCASLADGSVDCWGRSYPTVTDSQTPQRMPGLAGVRAVSSGLHYNCALLQSGAVECWGDDGHGQLGDGSTDDSDRPVRVRGIGDAVAISAGGFHACAVRAGGSVSCWGRSLRGALGNGARADSSVPVTVAGIRDAVAVSAGFQDDETCALRANGRIACWGANGHGQLGDGRTRDSSTPVAVRGIAHAVAVAAGGQHVCAVLAAGAVYCWGQNTLGQLGTGTRRDSTRPVRVKGLPGRARAIAVAPRAYSCAALVGGAVYCWGANLKGQLGNLRHPAGSLRPVRAEGLRGALAVSTGVAHACATLVRGGAACWGYDDYGQLGDGPAKPLSRTPVAVAFGR